MWWIVLLSTSILNLNFSHSLDINSSNLKTSTNWNCWLLHVRIEVKIDIRATAEIYGAKCMWICIVAVVRSFNWMHKHWCVHFWTRRAPPQIKTKKGNAVAKVDFKFRSVTPMMTSEDDPVSADFHSVGSRMMLS